MSRCRRNPLDRFELVIELGNDEMQTTSDIASALRSVAKQLDRGKNYGKIMDANGNSVGEFSIV